MEVRGEGFSDKAKVRVQDGSLLFLETDKPIYKPGQTIHMQGHHPQLRAQAGPAEATVEVLDAKGIKIFRSRPSNRRVRHGHPRPAPLHGAQPGRLEDHRRGRRAERPARRAGRGVRPAQVRGQGGAAQGVVPGQRADQGQRRRRVQLRQAGQGRAGDHGPALRRRVGGVRQLHRRRSTARPTSSCRRRATSPACRRRGGMGNVMLEITVREKATGYEEKTTPTAHRRPSRRSPFRSSPRAPSSSRACPSASWSSPRRRTTSRWTPMSRLTVTYLDEEFQTIDHEEKRGRDEERQGPPRGHAAREGCRLVMEADSAEDAYAYADPRRRLLALRQLHPSGADQRGRARRSAMRSASRSTPRSEAANFYYEVVSRGRVVFSDFTQKPATSPSRPRR